MAQERFYDILVKELEQDIRRELRSEFESLRESQASQNTRPHVHTIPTLDISPRIFKTQKSPYAHSPQNFKAKTKAPISEVLPNQKKQNHVMNVEERARYEMFLKLGASLPESFTSKDLKREFRKLAHLYHPDRQIHLSPDELKISLRRFAEAKSCYDSLCNLLEK